MIKKMEKVLKNHNDNLKKIDDLSNEINTLTAQLETEEAAAEEAAESGDLEGYEAKAAIAAKTKARLHVAQAQRNKADRHADLDEVKAAWAAQAEVFDKDFTEHMAEIKKANETLAATVRAIVAQQKEAFKLRQQLAEMAGLTQGNLEAHFPMRTLSHMSINAVSRYLQQIELFDLNETMELGVLAMNHRV